MDNLYCRSCDSQVEFGVSEDRSYILSCDCAHDVDISSAVDSFAVFSPPSGKWAPMNDDQID
jgi:hypothetical protein